MITINTVSSTKFSYNGITYHTNFMSFVYGNKIAIINVYDGCIVLTPAPTHFSQFTVNGYTFTSVGALQNTLLDVIYTRVGGNVTGTGTTNYLPKFTGASTLGNSIMYETGGITYIKGYLSVDPFSPVSPLSIIQVGAKTTLNSSDAKILVNNIYDNSTIANGHAFADNSSLQKNNSYWAYASYDGRVEITGTGVSADHYVSFQAAPAYNFTGTMFDNFGTYTTHSISSGTITNNYGHYVANPVKTGSGVITNNYGIYIANQTSGANNYSIYSENGKNFFGGNVGIGLTTPAAKLDVLQEIRASYANSNQYRTILSNTDGNGRLFVDGSSTSLIFGTSPAGTGATAAERMRITSAGNLGIGTTNPSSKLDVNETSAGVITNCLTLTNASNTINTEAGLFFAPTIIAGNIRGARITGFQEDGNNLIGLKFYTGLGSIISEKMRITSGGNVGIGTTSPSTRLDVNGAITASGGFFNSDIRLKDLTDYDYNVLDIKPISYLWKDGRDEKKHVGYSAQDVQKVMPDAVNEGADGMLSVNYIEVLVAKIAELENRIKQFEK